MIKQFRIFLMVPALCLCFCLLASQGFAYNQVLQKESARTLTVAARAAVKASFTFCGLDAKPGVLRLFDTDFPIR